MAETEVKERPAHQRKSAVVDEIKAKFSESNAAVFTEYRGLTVSELARLRGTLRGAETEYKVYKNSLVRRAATDAGLTDLLNWFEGPVAIAFVAGDAVPAAKAFKDFAKESPALVIKGGFVDGRVVEASELNQLADLPPRDVLLAQLAGAFQAPMQKAAGLFSAMQRNAAYAIKSYIDQRVAGGEVAESSQGEVAETNEPAAEPETESSTEETSDEPASESANEEPESEQQSE